MRAALVERTCRDYNRRISDLHQNQETTGEVLDEIAVVARGCATSLPFRQKEGDMKKALARVFVGLVIVGTVMLLNPISKSKQAGVFPPIDGCRLTTLSGTYGFAFNGYVNTGSPVPFTPLSAAGTITFHPDGNFSRSFNASFGGAVFPVSDREDTYRLNPDCTFKATVPGESWVLIPVEGGLQIEFFVNTDGRVGAGTLTHQ